MRGMTGRSLSNAVVLMAWAAVGLAACGHEAESESGRTATTAGAAGPDVFSNAEFPLGARLEACTEAGKTGYDASTKTLTMQMTAEVSTIVIGVVKGKLTVNGNVCVDAAGKPLIANGMKHVNIQGTNGPDRVVFDLLPGSFGQLFTAAGGCTVDLLDGQDTFSLRGSTGPDRVTVGMSKVGDLFYELSGDKLADIRVAHAETFVVGLSDGNDIFSARGGTVSGVHLSATVSSVAAVSLPMTINGGEGDDTLTGGDADDVLSGGPGDDEFLTPTKDGADTYDGGPGTDLISYATRKMSIVVDLDDVADDGASKIILVALLD